MPRGLLLRPVSLAVLGLALAGCGRQGQTTEAPPGRSEPHSVTLTWDASTSPVGGYRVYRATNSGDPPTLLTLTPPGTTQYTDNLVEAGRTYFYFVTAFDSANRESVPSNKVSVTVPER